MYIIILGAPGAGKGTQAINIAKELKLSHIAPGDLFRQAIDRGGKLAIRIKEYVRRGMLVPDEITIRMILECIKADDCKGGVLLDGFPRNIKQGKALDEGLKKQDEAIDKALYIKVSEEELVYRLKNRWICRQCQIPRQTDRRSPGEDEKCTFCGGELYQRADDNEETIKKRLDVYFTDTMPVIEYYRKQGKLLEVDGEGTIDTVTGRILNTLHRCGFITK